MASVDRIEIGPKEADKLPDSLKPPQSDEDLLQYLGCRPPSVVERFISRPFTRGLARIGLR